MSRSIVRGGDDTERLYLEDKDFDLVTGEHVAVRKTDLPGVVPNMEDLIARHKGRYGPVTLYCRPGHEVLDFPCGSGYASRIMQEWGVHYTGIEFDPITVEYAKRVYGAPNVSFMCGDLTRPDLPAATFHVIACIEGIEHIDAPYQLPLVRALHKALRPGGTLVVSSPENPNGISGPSVQNKDHRCELTKDDFLKIMHGLFGKDNVELITYKAILSTGLLTRCFFGIGHKSRPE